MDEGHTSAVTEDNEFLVFESMASMQRIGDAGGSTFFESGSTLIDLDGVSEARARKAADKHRDDLARGHHVSERYKVLGEIARGGMGAVLEVQDNDLDRRVAMKVLLRDTRQRETDSGSPLETGPVNRFIAEAQLTGWLEHPNIVPVHELGLDAQGRAYFTMKRVKGRSLRQIMDKLRQGHASTHAEFPLFKLLGILLKMCDAIDFAHNRGILHRDLKPENIMVGQFGEVLVMDWGLAKQIEQPPAPGTSRLPASDTARFTLDVALGAADEDSQETREGTISGTPAYMAPEQAKGSVREISQRTDIFCLGAVLYEMLCLVPPYLSSSVTDALDQAREHRLLPPKAKLDKVLKDEKLKRAFGPKGLERARKFPRELVSVAMRAMARQRELRYNSVADFKRDIENFLSAQPVSAHRDNLLVAVNKWARRNPTRAAVATLVVIFVLIGGMVLSALSAKAASEQARLAETKRLAEEENAREIERRFAAQREAREQAERARERAERVAQLEKDALERELELSEARTAREEAFVPYSKGADLRARSATFHDWQKRAQVWHQAVEHFQRALRRDDRFVEAHIELANVYADLGYDADALYHFGRADAMTSHLTGRGHVEALMSFAMYDFQQKVLREGISGNFDEVFRRFAPVKEAAEPGSYYARIAEILLELGEAFRSARVLEMDAAQKEATRKMAEIEREGPPLWEVYTLLAIIDQRAGTSAGDYLRRARELKPNLPILVWLEIRQSQSRAHVRDREGLEAWTRFVNQYPYDPRGYAARAFLRFSSESEHNAELEISDLRRATELYPRYADAHKLLLRVLVREGFYRDAIDHIDTMRRTGGGSGLDAAAIDLIEAELTAGTGEFTRMFTLVISALEKQPHTGIHTFAQAAGVLLRDHEYELLVELCDTIDSRLRADAPPLLSLFRGRALTMLQRFQEAAADFDALERNPGVLPREYRSLLEGWADDARMYPGLLATLDQVLTMRRRFDIARILAIAGMDPETWVSRFRSDDSTREELFRWLYPADHVLLARGLMIMARRAPADRANSLQRQAVKELSLAFEEGYLNRTNILRDDYLAPLVTDPALAKYFDIR